MSSVGPACTGFFAVTLLPVVTQHVVKAAEGRVVAEVLDGVLSSLVFALAYAGGAALAGVWRSVNVNFSDGMTAAACYWLSLWGFWQLAPDALGIVLGGWIFGIHLLVAAAAGALSASLSRESEPSPAS